MILVKIVILVFSGVFYSGESCFYGVSDESDSGEIGDFGEYSESGEYCDIGDSYESSDSVDFGESNSS